MKSRFFGCFLIILVAIILFTISKAGIAQYTSNYPYFGLTSISPSSYWDSSVNYFNPTVYAAWGGLSPFAYTGIPDFGNFGFGYYGYPGTGAFGGYGSPISTTSAARPFGSFGLTSSGPSWSTSLLGIPSWIIYGVAGPWFRTPLY